MASDPPTCQNLQRRMGLAKGEGIKATPAGIVETDELRSTPECQATYELLKQSLSWE